jgi:4-hydroxy-tetrahydrodipicolinate synthase
MFSGSLTALITPFRNGAVDEAAFQALCDWQIQQGTSGLVPCGTTGESPTLSHAEHERVVSLCVEAADGRVPVIAGAGSNATEESISLTRHAKSVGATAALIVVPYYNKPTQEGLYRHFKAIHDAVDLPLVIYNIPGRSVVDMSIDTMERLARLPNIVGVKDATADLTRPTRIRLACGETFCQLSGEDASVPAFLAHGGHGCISVTSNISPRLCADLHAAWNRRDIDDMARLRDLLMPLHHAMFVETSPAPVKYAASLLGLCTADLRLPLVEPMEATKTLIEEAMRAARILE